MLGKVHGPYIGKFGKQFVVIVKHDETGSIISRKTIGYNKYLEEYESGLHRYTQLPRNVINIKPKIKYSSKIVKCSHCQKETLSSRYTLDQVTYFCSDSCREKYKRKQAKRIKPIYHKQVVIPIKGKEENYFIIIEKDTIKKIPIFIRQDKCRIDITEDSNGIILPKLKYDINDTVRIKSVPGYKKFFWVTEDGRVISRRSKCILKLEANHNGYKVFATRIGGRKGVNITPRVHRLVASAFVPNPEHKPEVNHKDGIKDNNYYTNLEWCTGKENMQHAHDNGLVKIAQGEGVGTSKLSNENAIEIRKVYETNDYSHKDLANIFNVSKTTIYRCLNRKTFNHI